MAQSMPLAGSALAHPSQADSAAVGRTPKSFGLYQWDKTATYQVGLEKEISALGTPPTYSLYFVDFRRGFPRDVMEFNARRNILTVVSQEFRRYGDRWDGHVLDSVLAGKQDAYFRKFAQEAKKYRHVVYFRLGFEMNGDWFPWGEKPKEFRAAWKRVHAIFHKAGASNVRFVFSPNVMWRSGNFEKEILPYYPGDAYVDVVGLDGYNFGDRHSRHHTWQSFDEVFSASIVGMKKHFPKKPLWITEVGCADGPSKSLWVKDFLQKFAADPDLKAFIWFNEDKQYAGEPNWRLDSDMDSMDQFREWAVAFHSITTFSLPEQKGVSRQGLPDSEWM
jgi:hypothetical protein